MSPNSIDRQILSALKKNRDYVSGERLSKFLRRSRSAIWKRIEALRQAGYQISAQTHKGYLYVSSPNTIIADELKLELKTSLLGKEILTFDSVDSTNRVGMDLAKKGCAEGTLIFAESQTKGRGRLGRSWSSPKSKGLYFSMILRPRMSLEKASQMTLVIAVAIVESLRDLTDQTFMIKWPNDIVYEDRKIAGILTEIDAEPDQIHSLTVGIGINVHQSPQSRSQGGISLEEVTGKRFNRLELAADLLGRIEKHYLHFVQGKFKKLSQRWEQYSSITGKRVKAKTIEMSIEGVAQGIDDEGMLWIRQDSGIRKKIHSGDITLLR